MIELALAAKSAELARLRRQIELLSERQSENASFPEKGHSRPQRSAGGVVRDAARVSLLVLIESLLREAGDGLSLADLVQKVTEGRRAGRSKTPRAIVDQAIFRLKAMGRIGRNSENLKFYFIP